jgi:uncharacterized membrane protein YoaK (UPF0700 family)
MSFAEALKNNAVRHVLLDQIQLSEALSPSFREQFGIHLVGIVLSIAAGACNAIAFAKFLYYVSHVSGSATGIGLRAEDLQTGPVMMPVWLVVYFIVGSFICGLIVHSNGMRLGQARYEVVLFLVSFMELVCWFHDLANPELLAAAMGVQNAMITSWSTAVVRTTHMTGTATDLGSSFGRIVMRFIRLSVHMEDEDWNHHVADRKKLVLMICLLLSFIAGGYIGAIGYNAYKIHSLLIPAGLTFMLGVMHLVYCLLKRKEVKEEEVAETAFRRQISGKGNDVEQQRFVQGNSPEAQFIRQISGQKPESSGKVAGKPVRVHG